MSSALETKQAEKQLTGANVSPLAEKPAAKEILVNLANLEKEYFDRKPDLEDSNQLVAFGTSGHPGTSLNGTFTEAHVLAITQAICDYRKTEGTTGPLYMGKDTQLCPRLPSVPRWKSSPRTTLRRSFRRKMASHQRQLSHMTF